MKQLRTYSLPTPIRGLRQKNNWLLLLPLRTTRGISGGGVPPWPAANFHLRYRYGENFLCPGNDT